MSENLFTLTVFDGSHGGDEGSGETRCHEVAPSMIPVSGTNDSGMQVDPRVPANEQFRGWIRQARQLAKNKRLPKTRRLICDLVVESLSLMDRKPARPVRR